MNKHIFFIKCIKTYRYIYIFTWKNVKTIDKKKRSKQVVSRFFFFFAACFREPVYQLVVSVGFSNKQ